MWLDKRIAGYITTSAKNNISELQLMLGKSLNIVILNPSNTIFRDTAISPNICRHDDRDPFLHIIRGV